MSALKFSEPTICDFTCFYDRGHDGPHQWETEEQYQRRIWFCWRASDWPMPDE